MFGLMVGVLTSGLFHCMLLLGDAAVFWVFTQELFLTVALGFSNFHLFILLLLKFSYQRLLLYPH